MTDEQQQQPQQNYTVTTTAQNKNINVDTFPFQFSRAQYMLRCTPPVEASSDEEQYYIRTFHDPLGHADMQLDVPPSRGIWWPRLVHFLY